MGNLLKALTTPTGMLISVGIVTMLITFLFPLFIPFANTWENTKRLATFTDIGLSISAVLVGLGLFLTGIFWFWLTGGFLFAFDGRRVLPSTC